MEKGKGTTSLRISDEKEISAGAGGAAAISTARENARGYSSPLRIEAPLE